jgi:ribosome-binding protein aMBF1 (putative translation factor)
MNHQDWSTVTLVNKDKQKTTKQILERKGDTSINDGLRKIENETENFAIQRIPKLLSKEITECRLKLKLTQKDLANKLNIQQNIYVELENGKALYSAQTKQLVGKLERVAGVKFENKKSIP